MKLFYEKERTRTHPREYSESLFQFYDSHSSPVYSSYRKTLNTWFASFPYEKKKELKNALIKNDETFASRMLELVLYTTLSQYSDKVLLEEKVLGTSKRPDFIASNSHHPYLVYEATSANFSAKERSKQNLKNNLTDQINKFRLPHDVGIGLTISKVGDGPISSKRLWNELCKKYDLDNLPTKRFEHSLHYRENNWRLRMGVFKLSYQRKLHVIQNYSEGFGWVSAPDDFKKVLTRKSKEYKNVYAPIILAVFCNKNSFDGAAQRYAMRAIYGGEGYRVSRKMDFQELIELDDGFFSLRKTRNENISAVVVFPRPFFEQLDKYPPQIYFNPHARLGVHNNDRFRMNFFEYVSGLKYNGLDQILPMTSGWRDDPWEGIEY